MVEVTGLSGNEIYCMHLAGYDAGEIVLGNSVISRGFWGSLASSGQNFFGGEVEPVTAAIQFGRTQAFERMVNEAKTYNASGVAGVVSELSSEHGHTEFIFVGSSVNAINNPWNNGLFTSAGDAQELYCHIDAGYRPIHHAFGNIAYSVGVPGLFSGGLKTLRRGEVTEFSNIFNQTRHAALNRLVADARDHGANAVVGIRTEVTNWMGTHEMLMTGTAAKHEALPLRFFRDPVTSDLTGEELWTMSKLGYAPVKLLLSTSIFSLALREPGNQQFKPQKEVS